VVSNRWLVHKTTVNTDIVILHTLWRQTDRGLERYRQRVAEGQGVEAAQEFAQYVIWSGIPKLLAEHRSSEPLIIDGCGLQSKAEALLSQCHEFWRSGSLDTQPVLTGLEQLNRKFDLLAGVVSQALVNSQVD